MTRSHPVFAPIYARRSLALEGKGAADHRKLLLSGLSGRIIEIGAGNGLNFSHYPTAVSEVVAVEPEPYLLERASAQASRSRVHAAAVCATAEDLPLSDGLFDAAVCSLVLCSVELPSLALTEIHRVVRRGGELRFYEHVAAADGLLRIAQRLMAPAWRQFAGGCRLMLDTEDELSRGGFDIERCERLSFRPTRTSLLTSPHILGIARRR